MIQWEQCVLYGCRHQTGHCFCNDNQNTMTKNYPQQHGYHMSSIPATPCIILTSPPYHEPHYSSTSHNPPLQTHHNPRYSGSSPRCILDNDILHTHHLHLLHLWRDDHHTPASDATYANVDLMDWTSDSNVHCLHRNSIMNLQRNRALPSNRYFLQGRSCIARGSNDVAVTVVEVEPLADFVSPWHHRCYWFPPTNHFERHACLPRGWNCGRCFQKSDSHVPWV